MNKIKVVIVSCSDKKLWYVNHINEEFLVEAKTRKDGKKYIVKHNGEYKWIYEDDVKIVREVYKCIKPLEVHLLNEGGTLWIKYENTIKYTERELMYNSELHNRVILVGIKGNKYIEIDKKEFKEKFKIAGYTGIIPEFDIKIR